MSAERSTPKCPLCAKSLIEQTRVVQELVPATVPEYFTRAQSAVYRRIVRWTVVKCSKGHEFKRVDSSLYGMQHDL